MDKVDRLLARLASAIAVLIALWYWFTTKTQYQFGQGLICRYAFFWIVILLIIFIFYLLLVRAILKHLLLLKKHHVHSADENASAADYNLKYYSVLFEAFLVISIILITVAGFLVSGAGCALHKYL